MAWFTTIKRWGENIWPAANARAVASFSYGTITHLFNHLGTLPAVGYSICFHKPTLKVTQHLVRIVARDLVPLVLVTYASALIQDKYQAIVDKDPNKNLFISTASAIQYSLYLLQAATWVYSVHAKTRLLVRSTIVTLEAPVMLNGVKTTPPMTVCTDEHCSTLRFMQGSLRDVITYFTTEAAISLIEYVPVVGSPVATALAIYHRGRYVVISVLPDLCNRHHMEYLSEYPELALSAGLNQAAGTWAIDMLIESSTGIPSHFYKSAIEQLMLITEMSIAAHLILPKPIPTSARATFDPVRGYQNMVGFMFDTILLGLKIKIPRMLSSKQPANIKYILQRLPWPVIFRFIDLIRQHPLSHILLPQMVLSLKDFIHDPIVRTNWPALQETLISILKKIQSLKELNAVKISSSVPDSASTLIWLTLGTPKAFTKVLLQLINDEDVLRQLHLWQYQLERLTLNTQIPVTPDKIVLSLRGQSRTRTSAPLPVTPDTIVLALRSQSHTKTGTLLSSSALKNEQDPVIFTPPMESLSAEDIIRTRHGVNLAKKTNTPANPTTSLANLVIRHRYPKPSHLSQGIPVDKHQGVQDEGWVKLAAEDFPSQGVGDESDWVGVDADEARELSRKWLL